MKIGVSVEGDLAVMLREEGRAGAVAVTRVMAAVGAAVKANWRGQIVSAGLGTRLGNTIRSETYPLVYGRFSLDASARVRSKASKIVGAFDKGAVIRGKNTFWLAIPLPAAGKGRGGKKMTPGEWQFKNGLKLVFVQTGPGRAILVAEKSRVNTRGVAVRDRRRVRGARSTTVVPIFALVPQVTLRKRLGLLPAAERIGAGLGARIVSAWR